MNYIIYKIKEVNTFSDHDCKIMLLLKSAYIFYKQNKS